MIPIDKVSIIIPCYNDPDVVTAVQSAMDQTYSNKEIILVDDGSNLETKKIITSIRDKVDLVITQDNKGQSNARNIGINKASGNFILILDSDDSFEMNFSEKAVKKLQNDELIKIVTCKARRFSKEREIDVFTPRGGGLNNFLFANSALGSSMFRKKDWENCGGYDEILPILGFEDWEFYIRLLKDGGYAYVMEEVLFNYQVRKGSTTARIKEVKQDKYQEIILKHSDLYKTHFEDLVIDLSKKIKRAEKEKRKILSTTDFRLGYILLAPARVIRNFFNS